MSDSEFAALCVALASVSAAITIFCVSKIGPMMMRIHQLEKEKRVRLEYNHDYGLGVTSLPGYIARDIDNRLFAYAASPMILPDAGIYVGRAKMQLPQELMPSQVWGMAPTPAWIEIRLFRPVEGDAFDVHLRKNGKYGKA